MTTMIAEVYDALREAGASEGKSRAAAEAISAYENKFDGIDRRFDGLEAKLDLRFAELESRWDKRIAELESRWDKRIAELESRWDKKFAEQSARIDRLEARLTFQQWQLALLMAGVASLVVKAFFTGSH